MIRRAHRRPGAGAGRRGIYRGFGGGGPSIPAPTWELDARDAVGSPTMTSWPMRRTGGTLSSLSPLSGQEPQVGSGIVRGGIAGVLFPTTAARAQDTGTLSGLTTDTWSLRLVYAADEGVIGAANFRGYPMYIANNTATSTSHLAVGHESNDPGNYDKMGVYWPTTAPLGLWRPVTGATPTHNPRVVHHTFAAGVLTTFVNGVQVGTRTDSANPLPWAELNVGAAFGAGPITTASGHAPLKGTIWSEAGWVGTALTPSQVAADAAAQIAIYGIAEPTWTPASVGASLTGWYDSRGKQAGSTLWLGAATLDTWLDQSGGSRHMVQGTVGAQPADGAREGGYASVLFDGSNDFTASSAISAFITAAAGEIIARVRVRSVAVASSAPVATSYGNDLIFGDNGGFLWCTLRNNGGVYTVIGGLWDGAPRTTESAAISLNTWYTIGLRWTGGTLTLSINSTDSSVAAGSISTVTGFMRFGGATKFANMDLREAMISNAALSGADRTSARAWLSRT